MGSKIEEEQLMVKRRVQLGDVQMEFKTLPPELIGKNYTYSASCAGVFEFDSQYGPDIVRIIDSTPHEPWQEQEALEFLLADAIDNGAYVAMLAYKGEL